MPKNTAAASKKFNTRRRYVSEIQNALLSALYCGEIILLRKLDFNSDMRLLSPAASAGAVAVLLLPAVPGVAEHAQLPRVLDPGTAGMGPPRQLDSREDQEGHNVRNGFV